MIKKVKMSVTNIILCWIEGKGSIGMRPQEIDGELTLLRKRFGRESYETKSGTWSTGSVKRKNIDYPSCNFLRLLMNGGLISKNKKSLKHVTYTATKSGTTYLTHLESTNRFKRTEAIVDQMSFVP